jgi:hypothetical protein
LPARRTNSTPASASTLTSTPAACFLAVSRRHVSNRSTQAVIEYM